MESAYDTLTEHGYSKCIAVGEIVHDPNEWVFTEPENIGECRDLLQRMVRDPNFLDQYGSYEARSVTRQSLGTIGQYFLSH